MVYVAYTQQGASTIFAIWVRVGVCKNKMLREKFYFTFVVLTCII